MPVSAKSKKAWTQLAHTLDEIAPKGVPNPPSEMITSVVEAIYDDYAKANFTNYELRREDLNQLAAFARQFKDANEFLSQLALISNVDAEAAPNQTADTEAVNLSSVHQAKGLEYHTVFVIWLTDGMFPSTRSLETREAIEEERRLFYVAITRARDELYLTYPHMRLNAGYGDMFQRPSRFLKEIPTAARRGLAGPARLKASFSHGLTRMKHGLEADEVHPVQLLHRDATEKIIGAAFEVHQQLGYGFFERVYQRALQVELVRRGCSAEIEKRIQVLYKGVVVGDYDADLIVDNCVVVEVKIAAEYDKRDEAQFLNELKATGTKVGLLLNFGRTKVAYKRLVF